MKKTSKNYIRISINSFFRILIIFATGMLLISCGKHDAVIGNATKNTGDVWVSSNTWAIELTKSGIIETGRRNIQTPSGTTVTATQGKMIEHVENIATLDDLAVFNSDILNNPKKDHPKFIELQKKQILLWTVLSNMQSPEFLALQKSISTIYEGREFWTPEIQTLDTKIQETMRNSSTGIWTNTNDELRKIIDNKNSLLQKIYTKKEYQAYLQKNQSKLEELNVEMKKYWVPDMSNLQKEVLDLKNEVDGDFNTK